MKKYTISTYTFKTLEAAKKKLLSFANNGTFNVDTKIFRIDEEYDTEVKKIIKTKKIK